ncbi:ACP S-malonyltransferase [Methylocaldum szegediense]|uniref:[acyl-carrier-protein] S-malonyltransferase n=1 Tax=Methylocaldum szegediense TaxID=73780 RepID=A0ABM9I7C6_9GAMM|nr:acyltransferase domain-containing protein [Methylocaldum szegediense]CAI8936116.1 PKS_AT domain-containing protein [Methylocaldum szegediense]
MSCCYMFPGLGADYPGMIEKFRIYHPWSQKLLADWSELVGCDLSAEHAASDWERENLHQLRIHTLNLLWWRVVRQSSLDANYSCCGHSLGFYAAAVAAGSLTEEMSFRWLQAMFSAAWDEFQENTGKIAVITTNTPIGAHSLARRFSVEVLAINSAYQIVVYGSEQDIERLCCTLEGALIRRDDFDARIPFHSIRMWRVTETVAARAAELGLTVGPPVQALWSHITGERLFSADQVFATLTRQPCQTVLWQQLVRNLRSQHYSEFVEVGPSRVLTQIARWNAPHTPVRYVDNLRKAKRSEARG